MTGEEGTVTIEADPEVTKFLEEVEEIKVEIGELKSFRETFNKTQETTTVKIDKLTELFTTFVEAATPGEPKETPQIDDPKGIREIPARETQIEGGEISMHKEDAIDAGLRAIVIGSLDPDVKEIHLMSDLAGRYAYKPRPDPRARGYNNSLIREVLG